MPSAVLKPAIPAIKRLQLYALHCTPTGIGLFYIYLWFTERRYQQLVLYNVEW